MKIVTLNPKQFHTYTKTHRYRNYYQTIAYGNTMIKFGYNVHYLGILDENNILIGATMMIYKNAFMSNKIAYAPRGILFDYTDPTRVTELVQKLKQLLGKQGFMLLRMDPYIPVTIRDNKGNIKNFNNQVHQIMSNLKNAGFEYKGSNLFFENEKPRWEAIVILKKNIRDIFGSFDKRTRRKIRKAAASGIEIKKDESKNIKTLYEFIKRKSSKPIEYYQELCSNYDKNINIYYAILNTETFVINSRKLYEMEMDRNDLLAKEIQNEVNKKTTTTKTLNKKMDSDKLLSTYKKNLVLATELLKKYPDGFPIGGGMTVIYDQAAYLIIEGFNEQYSHLNPNYLLKWRMIEDYYNQNLKYFNLNAIVGEFEKDNHYSGLNEMKLGYNAVVTEYIGEFDIVLNNLTYSLYKGFNKNK